MNRAIYALRQQGYRLTPQRRAVLDVIAATDEHLTPAEIYRRVRRQRRGIGLVTVYRTLDIFSELGLICELRAEEGRRTYLLTRPAEHHHHLICSSCGTVVDFAGCQLQDLERRLSQDTGFQIDRHVLEFSGCCPGCQRAASA